MAPWPRAFPSPDIKLFPGKSLSLPPASSTIKAARSSIPRSKLQLPVSVDSAAGDIAEIQGRGAVAPDALAAGHEGFEVSSDSSPRFHAVVGEAGGEQGLVQLVDGGDPNGLAV